MYLLCHFELQTEHYERSFTRIFSALGWSDTPPLLFLCQPKAHLREGDFC